MLKIALAALALLIPAHAFAGEVEEQALAALVRDYEAFVRQDDPITAGQEGDAAALARLPDVTPAADAVRRVSLRAFQERLRGIDPAGLSEEGRLNHGFLAFVLKESLEGLAFDESRMPFSNDSGFHTEMAYLAATTPIDG
ncbi:MAG TPA: DUF885 domain-containing protein, partial [Caulobacteraceae bacterium]|nr:DUF885 domain-containing protein [Caulobacteraceae bacterium]